MAKKKEESKELTNYLLTVSIFQKEIAKKHQLTHLQKDILLCLATFFNQKKETIYPKVKTLAACINRDDSSISGKGGTQALVVKGLIKKVQGKGQRIEYQFTEEFFKALDLYREYDAWIKRFSNGGISEENESDYIEFTEEENEEYKEILEDYSLHCAGSGFKPCKRLTKDISDK